MKVLSNNLAGRYISALALKKTGKRIKLMAGGGLIIFAILFMLLPSQAQASTVYLPVIEKSNHACLPGLFTGGMGMITGVNLNEDNSWNITVETPAKNAYILQYAPVNVATRAGALLGQKVEFHGTIATSFPGCQAMFLINWNFSHNK